ncbi:MAG TPA: MFS transporter [Acidimicrobiales bacterium]
MRALVAVVLVVTSGVLPGFLVGAVGVQVRADLGFGEAGLGVAVGVFFTAAALTSAVLGRVAERLGPQRSMRYSAALSTLVLLGVAAFGTSFAVLLAFLAAGGAANALAQPAANVLVARTISARRLGLAFAVKQSGVPAATLLGGLAVPAIALTVGWRWAFAAGALLGVAGFVTTPAGRTPRPAATTATEREASRAPAPPRKLSLRPLVVLGVGIGFGAAAAGTLGAFLVDAAVASGIDEGASGLLVSAGAAFGIAMRLTAGFLADRRGHGHLLRVSSMLLLGAIAYLAYATEEPLAIVVATPLAFGAGWGWPGLFNLAIVRANPDAPGAASGVTQTGTYFGAMAGPVLFGAIAETSGYRAAWSIAAVLSVAGAATIAVGRVLLVRDRDRRAAAADSIPAI